jgi:hypothetical protein
MRPTPTLALIATILAVPHDMAVASTNHLEARVVQAARPVDQPPGETRAAVPTPVPPALAQDAEEARKQLEELLRQYPPSLADVLRLDPSMLTNQQYLATYPALAAFLAQHPEVAHNPAFFVGTERGRSWYENTPQAEAFQMWRNLIDGLQVFAVILVVTGALTWLIRTLLDYRRWLRLTRTQTEVHTKLLDRFASNQELLAYIQSPSGRRFLESSPIALEAEPQRAISAPLSRILWSVQAGVVLASGGVGLLYVSGKQMPEIAGPLFAMGSLAVALGLGFVISAVMAYFLSLRLGLLPSGGSSPSMGSSDASA